MSEIKINRNVSSFLKFGVSVMLKDICVFSWLFENLHSFLSRCEDYIMNFFTVPCPRRGMKLLESYQVVRNVKGQ
jgi:hypothetical protein